MSHGPFSSLVMLFNFQVAVAAIVICVATTGASAQNDRPYIYPSKGQTRQQQDRDKYECDQWAVSQSGFDPGNPSSTSTSAQQPQREATGGAARGAAVGAVGGAISGDAGAGAASGAVRGRLLGAIRRRRERNEAEQKQEQAQAAGASGQESYKRAFATCMQGRGYAVN
jgi:Glycine-zipper domain